ncbi:acetyl-CoA ligase [Schizosaccharomyces cryophilus OY26]|uniref:Acetyl-coenzyme A synthetase n=1 Tax=Schizosaccharomyces cryophilus (strain OY26 / ATCC MYA-4695 / CBS 11777 / NBRC 106824 / NRRL Y48691) TaxID=653667 RepID=S9VUC2_SCHCR|nr:acetyl-CoA ligase [Schizosaccharomyces cryophilus OY26]EPY51373.1 acetyl-CoA ligase [Schizosaccharomyces cryophilus OY26]
MTQHAADYSVVLEPPARLHKDASVPKPNLSSMEEYKSMYEQSIRDPTTFWGNMAREMIHWQKPFETVKQGSIENADAAWFTDGLISPCYNLVDRHAIERPNDIALIYEADELNEGRYITYRQLLADVSQFAGALAALGVTKGDRVAIYMPMIPETVIAMLAVIRLGAIHSIIFAGFSAESVTDRINDSTCKLIITCDESHRGGKRIPLKSVINRAFPNCPSLTNVLVFQRSPEASTAMEEGRDIWWHDIVPKFPKYYPPAVVNPEHPLFLLYTSGSTGKPKGVVHTTGGYLLGAAATCKYIFDLHPTDRMGCAGDVGWITGHTYIVYGPLMIGSATLIFEGTPAYPDYSRYWSIVERHKLTQWYIAPTAIRLLQRAGDDYVKYDRSSLRVLGSVGEPIAPESFMWYYNVVGQGRCAVADTYWQTETGSHIVSSMGPVTPMKPGSATLPFFGIDAVIIDPISGQIIEGNGVEGVLAVRNSWPSAARTVWKGHDRFIDTYLKPYPGVYFTGDGAYRDKDGYIWIRGRVDDVVNISGHRLSTAEIEAALLSHDSVAESAVVGIPDELTGQAVNAFILLKPNVVANADLEKQLIMSVRSTIGPFAAPRKLIFSDLPKTRSGKIMRRILRKILAGETDQIGDVSTLAEPKVVEHIIHAVHHAHEKNA